jgi:glycosyltransferase involved in cell wall biosynthesis
MQGQNIKKILFLIDHLGFGGAQMHLIGLINGMGASIDPYLIILGNEDSLRNRMAKNIPIVSIVRKWRFDVMIVDKIISYIEKNNITTVVATNAFCFFFIAMARLKMKRKLDVSIIFHLTKSRDYWGYILTRFYLLFLRNEDKLITTCDGSAQYISSLYRIPYEKFHTIYNGVDTEFFTMRPDSFDRGNYLHNLQIPVQAQIILQVATYRKEKAHENSIKGLHYLHTSTSLKPYLVLVGGANDVIESSLKKLSATLGIAEYVRFCPMTLDLREYYWSSNLFTLSSIAVETFSMAALEALSSGVPCVLTDLGGAREMINDGANGYVVAPGSPVALANGWRNVLSDKLLLGGKEIRCDIITRFHHDLCVSKYELLFSSGI